MKRIIMFLFRWYSWFGGQQRKQAFSFSVDVINVLKYLEVEATFSRASSAALTEDARRKAIIICRLLFCGVLQC
jgi:hypothetical protein